MTKLYLMRHTRKPLIVKIGISRNTAYREQRISQTINGDARTIVAIPMLFAYPIEQWIHRVCKPLHRPQEGSGGTEWFWFPAGIFALVVMVVMFAVQLAALCALVYGAVELFLPYLQ